MFQNLCSLHENTQLYQTVCDYLLNSVKLIFRVLQEKN